MPRTRPIRRPALAVLALALVAPVAQALPSAAATPSAVRGDEIVLVDKTSGPGTTCSRLLRGVIGGEVKEIATSCGTSYFYRPQLSPDGQLIAMESNLAPGGSLNVVDRNGQEVFRGTSRTDVWNGSIRGQKPVPGTYVWRFQQDNEDGERYRNSGTVTILQ